MNTAGKEKYICSASGWTFLACTAYRTAGGDCFSKWVRSGEQPDSLAAHFRSGSMNSAEVRFNAKDLPICIKKKK